jgi:UDP-N-acetylglucosamine acyltransferase
MNNISKLSIISKNAKIGKNVEIGPYCIIEDNVIIGNGNIILPYVHIKSGTKIGNNNKIFQGAIIGEDPQDLKFDDEETTLIIGNNNTIREYCTLNRGTSFSDTTIIKDNCLLMAYVHVAHDCIVQSKVILANGVQLGGHVEIGYHATVGGMSPVHQFCKVGEHAFIGGGRVALQDVPPFILATGEPLKYAGINSVGLRRRNFNQKSRRNIKNAYKLIYKSNLNIKQAVQSIKDSMDISPEIKTIIQFIKDSDRGLI